MHVAGSSYRGIGARALALPDGDTIGLISGGCLEGDLLERAGEVLADGRARTVRYDSTAPEDALLGLGLGCNGVVDVLLERVRGVAAAPEGRYLELLEQARCGGRRSALATVYQSPTEDEVGARLALVEEPASAAAPTGPAAPAPRQHHFGRMRPPLREALTRDLTALLEAGRSRSATYQVEGAPVQVLLELVEPPLALTVCGAGPDAEPLVTLAANLGWAPVVFDHRAAFARPERFPGAARVVTGAREEFAAAVPPRAGEVAVLMTHSYPTDLTYLEQLAPRNLRYIGVLGPRRRLERLREELGARPGRRRPVRPGRARHRRRHAGRDRPLDHRRDPGGADRPRRRLPAHPPRPDSQRYQRRRFLSRTVAAGAGSERVAGVILAAGASERLGRPKQLLRHRGEPLIHRAARLAHAAGSGAAARGGGLSRPRGSRRAR